MSINIHDEHYYLAELFEIPALYTCLKIDRSTVPDGVYVYDFKHGDYDDPITVEPSVDENHSATVVLLEPLDFGEETQGNNKCLNVYNNLRFLNECRTFSEFINENSVELNKLKDAVKLIEDMTGHLFKSGSVGYFIYHPDNDKYLAINMREKCDYNVNLYRINFDVNIRSMGHPMNADGLHELYKEVFQTQALLTALEMHDYKLNPAEMQEFKDYIREQDNQRTEQEDAAEQGMGQSM